MKLYDDGNNRKNSFHTHSLLQQQNDIRELLFEREKKNRLAKLD